MGKPYYNCSVYRIIFFDISFITLSPTYVSRCPFGNVQNALLTPDNSTKMLRIATTFDLVQGHREFPFRNWKIPPLSTKNPENSCS